MKYELINYDVVGNARDGFEVNGAFYTGTEIEVKETATKIDIIKQLKKIGFLKSNLRHSNWDIDGEVNNSLYITRTTAKLGGWYPVCELRTKELSHA